MGHDKNIVTPDLIRGPAFLTLKELAGDRKKRDPGSSPG